MVYAFHIFLNFQTISKCLIRWIPQSQIFVSGISLGYLLAPWGPFGFFGPELSRPSLRYPSPLWCAAPQSRSQPPTGPQTRFAPPKPPQLCFLSSLLLPHELISPQSIFYTLFLNDEGRILKNGLSKLHYRFRRDSTLTKTVLLESQYLQSYDSLSDFLRPKFEEDRHNFADIEIWAQLS